MLMRKKTSQVGGFLTLMLETEAGSGTYEKSTSSSWPGVIIYLMKT